MPCRSPSLSLPTSRRRELRRTRRAPVAVGRAARASSRRCCSSTCWSFTSEAHEATTREAAIESAVWVSCGVAFTGVIWWWFGAQASGEYISGYLIEKSLSVDNVFVWALIMGYFVVPRKYQHRVLFWGIFGALRAASDLHLRRRRADREVRLDPVPVRCVPAVHGGQAGVRQGEQYRSGRVQVLEAGAPGRAVHRRVRRAEAVHEAERQAAGDAAVRRAGADRSDRRGLRGRLGACRARPSATSSSSCSRRMRSPSSACGRCTSCSPTCTPGSAISRRVSRSSWPSSA